jgi:tryptophan synthase beta chain
LKATGRVTYLAVSDREAEEAFALLARCEGIVPALESAHAIAYACRLAEQIPPHERILVNLSGRGDKDAVRFAVDVATAGARS